MEDGQLVSRATLERHTRAVRLVEKTANDLVLPRRGPRGGSGETATYGFAQLAADLLDTNATGDIENYTPALGEATPGTEPATIGNPRDLAGDTGAAVLVIKTGSSGTVADDWTIAAVLTAAPQSLGVCVAEIDYSLGNPPGSGEFSGFAYYQGSGAVPAALTNPDEVEFASGDVLLVREVASDWVIVFAIEQGAKVRSGLVSTATAATWDNTCNALGLGSIEAWEFLTAADIPAFDSGTSYSAGDLVTESGNVYCADDTIPAGAFDAADWTDVSAQDRYLDRSAATVTLPNHDTFEPPEGALVKWIGDEVVYLTCEAFEGWA